jgi:phage protein U
MPSPKSFQRYDAMPSAIISDGITLVPLWSVSTMALTESYHLPPIGSSGARTIVATHDDTITLNGVLPGPERFTWKVFLETLADLSQRGSAVAGITSGRVAGLILVTAMTIRTDMYVQSLSFTASAARRDVLDVALTMTHMPLPGALGQLLDMASVGIAALADFGKG